MERHRPVHWSTKELMEFSLTHTLREKLADIIPYFYLYLGSVGASEARRRYRARIPNENIA